MPNALLTVRCPDEIMEAIAQACKTSGQSKTDVVVNALRLGLGINPNKLKPIPPADVDEKIRAAIAPILARLEKLEQQPEPVAIVLPSEPERMPIIEALNSLATTDKMESMGNHTETTIKPIAGDFSRGLIQAELQRRLGLKNASDLSRKKRDSEKMATLKDRDPDGWVWEWDELKCLYFPVA